MTLVEELEMIVGKWFVQLAAIRRWYFPLCIDIIHFYFNFIFGGGIFHYVFILFFILFLFLKSEFIFCDID